MTKPPITSFPQVESLLDELLDACLRLAERAIRDRGVFRVALSGGSTPKRLYERLASSDLDFSRVEWFWGDERNVPPDHPDSNFRMVREALLDPAHVPSQNIFPVPVDVSDPAAAAQRYQRTLKERFGTDLAADGAFPRWDLVLLGLGDDVHTASLFPNSPALDVRDSWFVENWVEKLNTFHYTLTVPAIRSADEIWLLVTGSAKREAMARLLSDERNPQLYPAQAISPTRCYLTNDAVPPNRPA